MRKYALITGISGFVGSHFRDYLLKTGWEVYGVDIVPFPCNHAGLDGEKTDARDYFREASQRFDLVLHCAAIVGGRKVIDGAPLALASNLELDAGLFQWALRTQPGRIIYFSSSAVYPVFLQQEGRVAMQEYFVDLTEDATKVGVPDQLYGWAKLTGEKLAVRARQEGVPVTVVRPFSGYGSDQSPDYPFTAFIDRALRREDPFSIWGSGSQVRDFIHINDIVRATMAMAEQGIDGPVNLSSGVPVALRALAGRICRESGYAPRQNVIDGPEGVTYRVGDARRLNEFYKPSITLEEGIQRALKYRKGLL